MEAEGEGEHGEVVVLTSGIQAVGFDILQAIMGVMDYMAVTSLMVTCKAAYRAGIATEVWEELYNRAFPIWRVVKGVSVHKDCFCPQWQREGIYCDQLRHYNNLVNRRLRKLPDPRRSFARRMYVIDGKRQRRYTTAGSIDRARQHVHERVADAERNIKRLQNELEDLRKIERFNQHGGIEAAFAWSKRKKRRLDPFLPVPARVSSVQPSSSSSSSAGT